MICNINIVVCVCGDVFYCGKVKVWWGNGEGVIVVLNWGVVFF